jgi:8-oxo-dGTP pyrophosphatase MutT (NUDIX family)
MPLEDRADNLLDLLTTHPALAKRLGIAIVAHSFGGLVLKSLIRRAAERPDLYAPFLDRLGGLVFLGTPHEGSALGNFFEFIGAFVGATVTISELQQNTPLLRHLATWYRDHHDQLGLRSLAFLETQPLKLGPFRTAIIVDPASGTLAVNGARSIPVDADHTTISKPSSQTAQQYVATLAFLRECFLLPATLAKLSRQYAAVCYRVAGDHPEFLLVRTTSGLWTFPKGRPDTGRQGFETAENEAYEEAGVRGEVEREPFQAYQHAKRGKKRFKREEFAVQAYLLKVVRTQVPPEPDRNPTWFGPDEAKRALAEGRELSYAKPLEAVIDAALRRISTKA